MMLRKRSAISLCILIAAAALAVAPSVLAAAEEEEQATQRQEALRRIVGQLEEKLVRPVETSTVEKEAQSILSRLTAEQVEALMGGEELDVTAAAQPQVATGNEGVQGMGAEAVGDATSDLLFVPVQPCRVIDTRLGAGKMSVGEIRNFRIAGTSGFEGGKAGGCGIPLGGTSPIAAAVAINIFAVNPEGSGYLRAWPFGEAMPVAAAITYDNLGPFFSLSNGIILPISGVASLTHDIAVKCEVNRTHFAADITGYFTRFPVESFQGGLKSSLQTNDFTTLINLGDGACHELNSCTVTTDVPGTVVVEAWGQFVMEHAAGTLDRVAIGVETANPVVCLDPDSVNASDYEVPAALGSNPDVDFTISHGVAFTQPGGTTRTYRLSGKMVSGSSSFDKIENSRLICTFIPD